MNNQITVSVGRRGNHEQKLAKKEMHSSWKQQDLRIEEMAEK